MAHLTSMPPPPSLPPRAGEPALDGALLWSALPLLVLGVLLLKLGWLPRRRGNEPRCRQCGYDLTANASGRCPECGAGMSGRRAVVRGVRRRRPVVATAGILLVVLAATASLPHVRARVGGVDWYSHKPLAWIVADLRSSDVAKRLRALTALERREGDGALPAWARDAAAEAMIEAAEASPAAVPDEFLDSLMERVEAHGLTDPQQVRFFRSLCRFELQSRPKVVRGEAVPFRIAGVARERMLNAPSGWKFELRTERIGIDGQAPWPYQFLTRAAAPSDLELEDSLGPIAPGAHALAVVVDVRVTAAGGRELYHELDELTAAFAVVAEGQTSIRERRDPGLDRSIREAVYVRARAPGTVDVVFNGVAANVACDVLVRTEDDEEPKRWGTLIAPADGHGDYEPESRAPRTVPIDAVTVDVILRSNPALARRTVDFQEVWAGEVVLEDVRVDPP